MGRRWCEVDPWIEVNGQTYVFVVGGEIDPDVGEVDGPVEWRFHLRAGDSFAVLGTYDGFGQGEVVHPPAYDVAAGHTRRFEVKVPVVDAIRNEPLFEVFVGAERVYGPARGDVWIAHTALRFDEGDAQPLEEVSAAGTSWGTPFSTRGTGA